MTLWLCHMFPCVGVESCHSFQACAAPALWPCLSLEPGVSSRARVCVCALPLRWHPACWGSFPRRLPPLPALSVPVERCRGRVTQGEAAVAVTSRVSKALGEQPGTMNSRCCLPRGAGTRDRNKGAQGRETSRWHWGGGRWKRDSGTQKMKRGM